MAEEVFDRLLINKIDDLTRHNQDLTTSLRSYETVIKNQKQTIKELGADLDRIKGAERESAQKLRNAEIYYAARQHEFKRKISNYETETTTKIKNLESDLKRRLDLIKRLNQEKLDFKRQNEMKASELLQLRQSAVVGQQIYGDDWVRSVQVGLAEPLPPLLPIARPTSPSPPPELDGNINNESLINRARRTITRLRSSRRGATQQRQGQTQSRGRSESRVGVASGNKKTKRIKKKGKKSRKKKGKN